MVVTPVEIRHSSRQMPYTVVSQLMPMALQAVRVGMVVPPSTAV